jgi:hypothetical protein
VSREAQKPEQRSDVGGGSPLDPNLVTGNTLVALSYCKKK